MTHSLAILVTALLFGGMTLYFFGFTTFLFKALPTPSAGATLRLAFPWFYLFVVATAAAVLAAFDLRAIPVRQLLVPAINRATDSDDRLRFKWPYGASALVTLSHIAVTGWILARIV